MTFGNLKYPKNTQNHQKILLLMIQLILYKINTLESYLFLKIFKILSQSFLNVKKVENPLKIGKKLPPQQILNKKLIQSKKELEMILTYSTLMSKLNKGIKDLILITQAILTAQVVDQLNLKKIYWKTGIMMLLNKSLANLPIFLHKNLLTQPNNLV